MQTAQAAEVEWKGHYRSRMLYYDSLSLSTENPNVLGATGVMDHRLRLAPAFHLSSNVSAYMQLDMVPLTGWGSSPDTWIDPVTGDAISLTWADGQSPYADADNGASYLRNIQLTRAYADVYTPYGRIRFGRMPMDWGAGVLFNAGNSPEDEYGDTGDRVQFTTRAGPVYLMGGYELLYEGYTERQGGTQDDMHAVDLAVAFRSETMALGLYNRYRFQPSQTLKVYNGSLWGFVELGPAKVELEVVGVFGNGDISDELNDQSIIAAGAMLDVTGDYEGFYGGIQGGLATGDADPTDNTIRTFSFDRDHNVGLFMFEEPMPLLGAAVPNDTNGGRETGAVLSGDGVSNALYIRPQVGYMVAPDLGVDLTMLAARSMSAPSWGNEALGYGMEYTLGVNWMPYEHFTAKGSAGVFLPGPYYATYTHDELGGDFDSPAWGGRAWLIVDF